MTKTAIEKRSEQFDDKWVEKIYSCGPLTGTQGLCQLIGMIALLCDELGMPRTAVVLSAQALYSLADIQNAGRIDG